jgi:negative regulator of sigma E activity
MRQAWRRADALQVDKLRLDQELRELSASAERDGHTPSEHRAVQLAEAGLTRVVREQKEAGMRVDALSIEKVHLMRSVRSLHGAGNIPVRGAPERASEEEMWRTIEAKYQTQARIFYETQVGTLERAEQFQPIVDAGASSLLIF